MKTMTRAKELQVIQAVEQAVDLANQGMSPTDALYKVSSEHKLLPDFVKRLAETFNTSRMLAHFRDAPPEKRADEFLLADASEVLRRLYPDTVAGDGITAVKESCHSTWFDAPPDFADDRPTLKAAAVSGGLRPTAKKSMTLLIKRAANHVHALGRKVEVVNGDAEYFRELVSRSITKAAEYFRTLSHVPFAEVESNVLTKYGVVAKPLMNAIFLTARGADFGEKRGTAASTERLIPHTEPYNIIADALCYARNGAIAANEEKCARCDLATFKQEFSSRIAKLAGEGATKIPFPFAMTKAGGPVSTILGATILRGRFDDLFDDAGSAPSEADVEQAEDPEQIARLRAIKTKMLLNEWMANDPVISAYDQQQVLDTFNEISELTPRLADQPGVLRGLLSRSLEMGRVEPFEAAQTLEAEHILKNLETAN